MKRLLTIIMIVASVCLAAEARTAADFFVDAPSQAVPFLDKNARLDMLDYFRSKLPPKTVNSLQHQVRIVSESDLLLVFTAGDSINMQLGVVPQRSDTLLVVIETLPISVPDSRVTLYTSKWQPANRQLLQPALSEWLTKEGEQHRAEIEEWLPFMTSTAQYDPETRTVTFTNTIADYFSARDEQAARLLPYLKPQLSYSL